MRGPGAERAKGIRRSRRSGRWTRRSISCEHASLGKFTFEALTGSPQFLFTGNETNFERLYQFPNKTPYVKDAFDRYVVHGEHGAVNPEQVGTKAAAYYAERIEAGKGIELRFRLRAEGETAAIDFDATFRAADRRDEPLLRNERRLARGASDRAPGGGRTACGRSSFITSRCCSGWKAIRPIPRRRRSAGMAATTSGNTSTTAT